jgi:hypothetical protein
MGSVEILQCNYLSPFETLMSAQTEFVKVQFRSRSLTRGSSHLFLFADAGKSSRKFIQTVSNLLHETVYKWYVGG